MKTVIKGGDAVKTYARRDSATAALKKLGVQPSDYNLFIMQTTDGRVACSLDKAQEYLNSRLRKVATEEVPQKRLKGKNTKQAESNQIKRPTVSATIRKLILDGLSNKEIHEAMVRDFGHDEEKANYPGWYRSQMRRDGLIPRAEKKAKKSKQVSTKKILADIGKPTAKKTKRAKRDEEE